MPDLTDDERAVLVRQRDHARAMAAEVIEDKQKAEQEVARLQAALTATQAALANATKLHDLPQHTSTMPLDVAELRERYTAGRPVVRLSCSPLAGTDPGHVPAVFPAV